MRKEGRGQRVEGGCFKRRSKHCGASLPCTKHVAQNYRGERVGRQISPGRGNSDDNPQVYESK